MTRANAQKDSRRRAGKRGTAKRANCRASDTVREWRRKYDDGSYPRDFWPWIAENRHVFDAFVRLALLSRRRGTSRWSADGLCHVLRWRTEVSEKYRSRARHFKIDNCATAGLARLAMCVSPSLRGFFEIRDPPQRGALDEHEHRHHA